MTILGVVVAVGAAWAIGSGSLYLGFALVILAAIPDLLDGALAAPPDGFYLHEGNGAATPDGPPILLYGEGRDVAEFDHCRGCRHMAGRKGSRRYGNDCVWRWPLCAGIWE